MKRKKFNKKLVLNKETVAHLDPQTMVELRGGQTEIIICITPAVSEIISCIDTKCDQVSCPIISCELQC